MKSILLLITLCLQAQGAITLVNKAVASAASGSSIAISATSATAGNALVVGVAAFGVSIPLANLADTAGNTFYLLDRQALASNQAEWIFYARNILGNASNVVTATFAASVSGSIEIHVLQYSGVALAMPVDLHTGTTTSVSGTTVNMTVSTSYAIEALVGFYADNTTNTSVTAGSSFTLQQTDTNKVTAIQDFLTSSAQSSFVSSITFSNGAGAPIGSIISLVGAGQNPTFTYVRKVTFDHTKVGTVNNTDQTNFPSLLKGTLSYLATTDNGGNVQNTNTVNGVSVPSDVGFSTDSLCANYVDSTGLDFEIAAYTSSTGAFRAYVSKTQSHTTDTIVYMCYASCSVVNSPMIISSPWVNAGSYVAVHHFDPVAGVQAISVPSEYLNDSTNYRNDFVSNPGGGTGPSVTTTSPVGNGLDFGSGGVNAWFSRVTAANLPTGHTTFTLDFWFQMDATGVTNQSFAGWGTSAATGDRLAPLVGNTGGGFATNSIQTNCFACGGSIAYTQDTSTWHHFATTLPSGTVDTSILMYLDGSSKTITGTAGATINIGNGNWTLGAIPNTSLYQFHQKIAELRLSNIARSADWIVTQFNEPFSTVGTATINGAAICPAITGGQKRFAYISELFSMEFPWEQTCSQMSR